MATLFDIIGPVMIGPSSSHTAGACRIGKLAKNILGEDVREAKIYLHGSFALTWKGHGTDKAILAGLLGFDTDDPRLRDSYDIAYKSNLKYEFIPTKLREAFHPNTLYIEAKGDNNEINILASSIGGGLIVLDKVNGIEVHYKGDFPTIAIVNKDVPGIIAKVTSIIFENGINIENMNVTPQFEGPNKGYAIIVIGMTDVISEEIENKIRNIENIRDFVFLDKLY
ncbi:L-serine ammonia-lyase, iron-sulfur-dependent subunit beta [Brachyspira sp.]|uniref:L-serine ammonia-lyase, iron-sulfur-dependent subunit beta n=1 Tax=Brachyspira sp. TaxID=1977261 RepID=UPI002611D50A|nr:L-serine ammonia-lyase, iron-sulfur-dependent subunit beta [Brachyspira sp.]